MVSQSGHIFYSLCLCLEQSRGCHRAFLFWHPMDGTTRADGLGRVHAGSDHRRFRHAAQVVATPKSTQEHTRCSRSTSTFKPTRQSAVPCTFERTPFKRKTLPSPYRAWRSNRSASWSLTWVGSCWDCPWHLCWGGWPPEWI